MKTKTCLIFFVIFFISVSVILLSLVSCNMTSGSISAEKEALLCKQVKRKPYIALIEGMQPLSGESMKLLGCKLSKVLDVSVCATSGNHDVHMNVIREAYKYQQKIYIAGFSVGEREAIYLAVDCEKEGIPVEKLFLLDGLEKAKIPRNVGKVVDILGSFPYVFRRYGIYLKADLENKRTNLENFRIDCDHLDIPKMSYPIILLNLQ